MTTINDLLRPVFDLVQAPMSGLPPLVGIVLWSIPVGVFALWIFKITSNQQRIAEVKRRIHSCLFEIRLFNDDLVAIVRAQGEILRHVAHYQLLALKPMIFILPPLVLLMVHLHAFYGFRGLAPGQTTLVRAVLEDGWQERWPDGSPPVVLEVPEGLRLDGDSVWAPDLGELVWQVTAESWGDYELVFHVGDAAISKDLEVTSSVVRLSPTRPDRGFFEQLEWPSEDPLPEGSGLREISLAYPEADISLGGWHFEWQFAWMVVFFVLTMVIAVVLRRPLGVEL